MRKLVEPGDPPFVCPNHERPKGKPPNPGGCQTRAFLYPRGIGSSGAFHFHQGIDIGGKVGLDIVAVMGGEVIEATKEWTAGYSGYGKVVVIRGDDGRYYLYAHCDDVLVNKGERVPEKKVIAKTGDTYFSNSDKTARMSSAPHLHFEISREPYPKPKVERTPEGAHSEVREDPLLILAQLGPWGTGKKFFLPTGPQATGARLEALAQAIEKQGNGGYFPVGGNNFWHGGVHLFMGAGTPVKAPFPGRIVAARLDEDPLYAHRDYGGTNFILMRHDLPEEVAKRFKEGDPKPKDEAKGDAAAGGETKPEDKSAKPKKPAVGLGGSNDPKDVKEVARMLRSIDREGPSRAPGPNGEAPPTNTYWGPDDPPKGDDGPFVQAIKDYQAVIIRKNGYKWKPDGLVTVGGTTWTKLRAQAGGPPPSTDASPGAGQPDTASDAAASGTEDPPPSGSAPAPEAPKTTPIWCLFMHVEAVKLDDKQAGKVPWLGRARAPRSEEEQQQDQQAKSKAQQEYDKQKKAYDDAEKEDAEEAHNHTVRGTVGVKTLGQKQIPQQNLAPDVEWTKLRLKRFGFFAGSMDGTCSDDLVSGLSGFQARYVPICKGKGDGFMVLKGQTLKHLQMTRGQLGILKAPVPPAGEAKGKVDEKFIAPFRERGALEVTKIVTDLDIEVAAGEAVWTAGFGTAHQGEGLTPLVHWEIFSEQDLFDWEKIDDPNDDLSMDACDKLKGLIDGHEGTQTGDGVLTKDEVARFYASDAAPATRKLQCKFRGEWAAEPAKVAEAAGKLNVEIVGEPEEVFGPYAIWNELAAAKKVPSDPHVWHYNPVTFLSEYARLCGASKGELTVEVFVAERRAPDVEVALWQGGKEARKRELTDKSGRATFLELLPGSYVVEVYHDATTIDGQDVQISEGEITHLRLGELPPIDVIDADNPFLRYQRMRLTRCREGLGPVTLGPHYPRSGNSGVTLGYGYDVGSRTQDQVRGHLGAIGVPAEHVESLMPVVGMDRAHGAETWYDAHRQELAWTITEEQRYRLLELVFPNYEAEAKRRATTFEPVVSAQAYDALHWYIRELITDLTYVGAHYAKKNGTAGQVNTILANAGLDDVAKLKELRKFVEGMSAGLQPAAGKKWRLQYIDAVLAELDRQP